MFCPCILFTILDSRINILSNFFQLLNFCMHRFLVMSEQQRVTNYLVTRVEMSEDELVSHRYQEGRESGIGYRIEFNTRLKNTNKWKRVGYLVEADEIVFFFNRKKVEKVVKMNFKIKENLLIKTIQRHLNNVSKKCL